MESIAAMGAMAAAAEMGIPHYKYTPSKTPPSKETSDEMMSAAEKKRARKAAKNKRLAEKGGYSA